MAELQFRDGKRTVPDYFERLMAGMPLHKLTYEQAVAGMNKHLERNAIEHGFDRVVASHFDRQTRD